MWLGERVLTQKRRDPLPKVYSLHAPEVECIGKGKAHKPYEFGCKVSVAATNNRAPGGQFVTHMKAFHGNPYDGHTLNTVIKEMERWTGVGIERAYVDKGYAGHDYPNKFKVYKSGQKRGITPTIKKELRRRSAVEAVMRIATSRPTAGSEETSSRAATATRSTPSSPIAPATTIAWFSGGSGFCSPGSWRQSSTPCAFVHDDDQSPLKSGFFDYIKYDRRA